MEKASLDELVADLVAEHDALEAVLAPLGPPDWATPTPAEGWTVAHEVAHLTYFDGTAAGSITDPAGFVADRDRLLSEALSGAATLDELTIGELMALSPTELLEAWRSACARLVAAAATLGEGDRVEWYGPSMSARSFLTARIMEVWAHGQDVVDAVGAIRPTTDRLRHVAQLGVITRGWSYAVRGSEAPSDEVRVELTSPSGAVWAWGPPGAPESVTGDAEDFCLVVTQRRHVDDTGLEVTPGAARDWMLVAQAFAGGPTHGPPAASR
jgi:uncharacterized protein (TIGR03084 family)